MNRTEERVKWSDTWGNLRFSLSLLSFAFDILYCFETTSLLTFVSWSLKRAKPVKRTQLLQVLHNIGEKLDKRVQVDAIYLDSVKAFDRVNQKLLLKKLHRFGICSCPVDLVRRLSHWPRPKGHCSRSQRPASPYVIRLAARINTWTSLVPHICDWMTFRWRGDLCFSLCRWQEVLLANEKVIP